MIVDLFKKVFTMVRNMISEDKLAAATLAQIFGSELTSIDQATTHRSSSTPRATQLDPRRILLDDQHESNVDHINSVQSEAENAYPYQQPMQPMQPTQQMQPMQQVPVYSTQPSNLSTVVSTDQLDRICAALEKMVALFEGSEIILKKPLRTRNENK